MDTLIEITCEQESDYFEAENVIREAFYNVYMEGAEEHLLLHQLRNDENYLKKYSKIAKINNKIVGGIYYSKANLIDEKGNNYNIVTFGPLGILPEYQKMGIGQKLIEETIQLVKNDGYDAIIITGVPTYYPRLGFKSCYELNLFYEGHIQFPALLGYELKKGFFKKIGASTFSEAKIFETRASKKELDEFDSKFPYLKKEKRPTQWKEPNK